MFGDSMNVDEIDMLDRGLKLLESNLAFVQIVNFKGEEFKFSNISGSYIFQTIPQDFVKNLHIFAGIVLAVRI